jgi:hypothetical protein
MKGGGVADVLGLLPRVEISRHSPWEDEDI